MLLGLSILGYIFLGIALAIYHNTWWMTAQIAGRGMVEEQTSTRGDWIFNMKAFVVLSALAGLLINHKLGYFLVFGAIACLVVVAEKIRTYGNTGKVWGNRALIAGTVLAIL